MSLLLVVWIWHADRGRTSPGELSAVHAQVPRLNGPDSCELCHGTTSADLTRSCLSCHESISTQLADAKGLHGKLPVDSAQRCESCHLEHHGSEFRLVDRRAFALAGIEQPSEFDHAGLNFKLDGRHLTLACEKCHPNAMLDPLPIGKSRFLGLSDDCLSCHQDVHRGIYGADCAACHGQEHTFRAVAGFSHSEVFPLVGAHAEAKCTSCHPPGIERILVQRMADGGAHLTTPEKVRSCGECHASPHRQNFLQLVSKSTGRPAQQSCEQCHQASDTSFRGRDAHMDASLHALTGFPLDAPHNRQDCRSCHADYGAVKANADAFRICYPGRSADNCQACHKNPHQGDFIAKSLQQHSCLDCHSRTSFRPATLTAKRHDETGFKLSGVHQQVACEKCHPKTVVAQNAAGATMTVRHFAGAPASCRECHADPHRNEFQTAAFRGKDCSTCHTENSFHGVQITVAQHAGTGFPLSQVHQKVDCEKCHRQTTTVRTADGKSFQVHRFSGTPTACKECHTDPHQGQFSEGLFAGLDCLACHRENTFAAVNFSVAEHDHTRFPLTGSHAAVACRSCHTEVVTTKLKDRKTVDTRVFRGTPADCRSCHADIHRGAFDSSQLAAEIEGRTDCARCHTTERFDVLIGDSFDHAYWTGYPLGGAHADVKCAQCHLRSRESDQVIRTFGRAAGRDCQSCHQDPHLGQFGSLEQVDCARCHNVADSFKKLNFDHQTDSRFKLDKTHTRLDCAKCHRAYDLPNGGKVVRYKPLGTTCGDCHSVRLPRSTTRRPSSNSRGGTR